DNPTYDEVSSGSTGHVEAVQIVFDPQKITYEKILEKFWRSHDPTDASGQFADRGTQYRSVIFYHSQKQKKAAEESKSKLEKSHKFSKKIITEI
ncbi:peptide-methionine (S)-S-oxide reductase MsrA, partial [Staphylococcus aureus]